MTFILQIIIGIFVLGILVFIHELGHFLAAKACKIGVLSFSIGFGKPLLRKTYGNTEYRISAIPFGGYVHMKGEHPDDKHEQSDDEFMSKPVWQRAFVAISGPAANILSSIAFLWIIYLVGVPHPTYLDQPIVGDVVTNSPAAQAGILPGDIITSINSIPTNSWEEIQQKHLAFQDPVYTVTYIRKGVEKNTTIKLKSSKKMDMFNSSPTGLLPSFPARVGKIMPDSPAEKAGLQENDLIVAIDNTTIYSWFQIPKMVTAYDPLYGSLQVVIQRGEKNIIKNITPKFNESEKRYLLGFGYAEPDTRIVQYPLGTAFSKALDKSWEYTTMIFKVLGKIASAAISPKQLAGPVGIIQMSGAVALDSIIDLINLMALIGINLGVLNLFPLIITDGGVLLFLIIESLRRKPLSLKTQLLVNRIAIVFFIALFLFVTFNDIERIPTLFRLMGR